MCVFLCVCGQTLSSLTVENKSETAKLTSDLVLARTQVRYIAIYICIYLSGTLLQCTVGRDH